MLSFTWSQKATSSAASVHAHMCSVGSGALVIELQSEVHRIVHHAHVRAILHMLLVCERFLHYLVHNTQVINESKSCVPQTPILVAHQRDVKVFAWMDYCHMPSPAHTAGLVHHCCSLSQKHLLSHVTTDSNEDPLCEAAIQQCLYESVKQCLQMWMLALLAAQHSLNLDSLCMTVGAITAHDPMIRCCRT
jgi:hypothetical protein